MSEQQIASAGLLRPKEIPISQAIAGVISDPSQITGTVTSSAIAAGQQITLSDFAHGSGSIATMYTGAERAVAISIDPAHGLTSYLVPDDTVDIITQGKGGTAVLFQNITVLANQGGDVVLELTDKQALLLGDALELNLQIWLELRPATGATDSVKLGTVEKVQ
jgi:Flp pilus assembly protein CpaB